MKIRSRLRAGTVQAPSDAPGHTNETGRLGHINEPRNKGHINET
jgi:hypothetical protein